MVAPGRAPLAGLIEVDWTEIPFWTKADPVSGSGGRSPQGNMLVAGAVEIENDPPGRRRLAVTKDFSALSLHGPKSARAATFKTDDWPSCARARSTPAPCRCRSAPGSTAPFPMPRRGRSTSITAYEDSTSKVYLDEFVFRFGRRTRHPAFRSLLAIAFVRKPLTYSMLGTFREESRCLVFR
jgi:hypothetical protein